MFCHFTKLYLNYFIKKKYNLDDNNSLLLLIINERSNIFNFMKNTNIKIVYKYNFDYNINKYIKSYFVDVNSVNTQLKYMKNKILIKWNNNKIVLIIDKITDILLYKIKLLIYILEYLRNNNDKINIILILTKLKKYKPINNEIIDVKHINSGYSYNNNIFIWRYEEFEKVLLHEIIHVFKLDKRDDIVNNIINSDFHNYFEALTDFYAIIYHIIYLSLITNINIKLLLEIELEFIKNQALKMIDILDIVIFNNISNINVNQKTSAYSYYILKYLLFEYILKLNNNNLKKYLKKINYNLLLNNVLKIKIINSSYNNFESLRMTLFQLKY
jgi:hypothetical protein